MTRHGMDHLCACLGDLAEKLCSDAKPALEGPKAAEPPREAPKEVSVPLEVEKMEAFFLFFGGGCCLRKK